MTAEKRRAGARQGLFTAGAVLLASLVFGLFVLPWLSPANPHLGTDAPEFDLEVIHQGDAGSRLRLADLRGKPVILDFWASWCGPCRAQAPIIDSLAREMPGAVHVVGVNSHDTRAEAVQFAQAAGLSYASVFDASGSAARDYGVEGFPTMVIVDAEGKVAFHRVGLVPRRQIEEVLAGLAAR